MPLDDFPAQRVQTDERQSSLASRLFATRRLSVKIAEPLSAEDQTVQASEDASPAKWHLAHTSWFFEELVLKPYLQDYALFDERFSYCFNSYYESLGPRHPRARRGLLTRPSAAEVRAYRKHIDAHLSRLLEQSVSEAALSLIETGIHHEQQHQELMLTDVLALLAANPLRPAYWEEAPSLEKGETAAGHWQGVQGGIYEVGHKGEGFAYDNEGPPHEVLLRDFRLFSREVTNGEWLAFIEAGGYRTPSLWLADGWAFVQREGIEAPGYWERRDGVWQQMTLHGPREIENKRPVTHVSYYEADAFARFAGHRLPMEFEWEVTCREDRVACASFDLTNLLAKPAPADGFAPFFGNLWQWTASAYLPYPGFTAARGALGEYNGKFMCSQMVLRGGSFATPEGHIRPTYRNFFYPHQRWQMMGLRLASEA